VRVGVAQLFAGNGSHAGNVNAGLGASAHEVGHATGYNHSRGLVTSTQDYNDCYDQMSYNCSLPGFTGEAGPRDGIIGYDAINLEFHGWLPSMAIYNLANKRLTRQVTLTLHALGDPKALNDLGGSKSPRAYLDAQLPAKIKIEDIAPKGGPSIPPRCTGAGYHCSTSKYYTVEYRQVYGFDQDFMEQTFFGPNPPGKLGAVTVHLYAPDPKNTSGDGTISYLVNVYPGKKTGSGQPVGLPHNAALQPGDDYADPARHAYVAVNSFDKSSRTATVTLGGSKLTPKLTYNGDRRGSYGHLVMLSAVLTVDGAPVPNQPVLLKLNGQACLWADTDANGRARCNITDNVSGTLPGVGAPITAFFAGDSVYHSAQSEASFGGSQTPIKTPLPAAIATTVNVTLGKRSEYGIRLSTKSVALGTVTFDVTNAESAILRHSFRVCASNTGGMKNRCAGTGTGAIEPGNEKTLTVDFTQPGTYEYLSTVAGDAAAGMKGDLTVS
jgi:uncharacterized cupredoxin-like copper-binding protein